MENLTICYEFDMALTVKKKTAGFTKIIISSE
jgi:hypothetical protein